MSSRERWRISDAMKMGLRVGASIEAAMMASASARSD